jgi:hypothetical protein
MRHPDRGMPRRLCGTYSPKLYQNDRDLTAKRRAGLNSYRTSHVTLHTSSIVHRPSRCVLHDGPADVVNDGVHQTREGLEQ